MSRHLISIGDLVMDFITPVKLPIQANQHQELKAFDIQPGGSGNVMIAARRLGLRVTALGALGDDLFGAEMMRMFAEEDISTEGVQRLPGSRTTLVYDLIDEARKEHVFIGYNADGPLLRYTPEMDALLRSADAVFLQAYNLMERQLPRIIDPILDAAVDAGIPRFFDVGPTAKHATPERLESVLRRISTLMMTEDEIPLAARGMAGQAAYDYLFSLGLEVLLVKQGPAGCTILTRDAAPLQIPGFAVELVDTVGAGDCFNAAYMFAHLHGYDQQACGTLANAAGAASVQKAGGGRNVPSCAEVAAMLSQRESEIRFSC